MLNKPTCKEDLLPPFNEIGEPGWAETIRMVLQDYAVPLPEPSADKDLRELENKLGFQLPRSLCVFLTQFGPVDFGSVSLRSSTGLKTLFDDEGIAWFRDWFDADQKQQLARLLAIGDYGGDAGVVSIDPLSGICYLCQHDPLGIHKLAGSFDDLIKSEIILLSCGYFGYPDPEIEAMASQLVEELFGRR